MRRAVGAAAVCAITVVLLAAALSALIGWPIAVVLAPLLVLVGREQLLAGVGLGRTSG